MDLESVNPMAKINEFILNPLIIFLFAVAVAYFLYGVMVFVQNQNNDEMMGDGKRHMFWGVVGMFIMMAVGGILNVIESTLQGWFY